MTRYLFRAPCLRSQRIDPEHDMQMSAHHGIGMNADGNEPGQFEQAMLDPLAPMFMGLSVVQIDSAQ